MIVTLLITSVLSYGAYTIYHWWRGRNQFYRKIEGSFHGPQPLPIFGNALEFPLDTTGRPSSAWIAWADGSPLVITRILSFIGGIHDALMRLAKDYKDRFRLWLGPLGYVVLHNPQDVEVLLSSSTHITKSDVYRFSVPWIGLGLLTSTGAQWKERRRILTPAFHFKILEEFIDVFEENGKILVELFRQQSGKVFNVYSYCNLYALDNISETALGVSINSQKNSNSTYVAAVKSMCNVVNTRIFQPWLMVDMIFNWSQYGRQQREALAILHKHSSDNIKLRRKKKLEKRPEASNGLKSNFAHQKKRLAFLDLLLETEVLAASLTDAEIQEEVDTIMFAGHDTVTSGLSFSLYALSQHPEIQEKVLEEQRELFGDSWREACPSLKDYQEMKYLDRVIREVLRIYPSVPVIGRTIHEDLTLHDGSVIPKGAQAAVLITALHRNPNVWPNPDKFDPDNFLPDAVAGRNPFSHIPFSAGPRNCIGQRFAMLEMKSCISKVVRNFKLLPCDEKDGVSLVADIVLISKTGMNLKMEIRT